MNVKKLRGKPCPNLEYQLWSLLCFEKIKIDKDSLRLLLLSGSKIGLFSNEIAEGRIRYYLAHIEKDYEGDDYFNMSSVFVESLVAEGVLKVNNLREDHKQYVLA